MTPKGWLGFAFVCVFATGVVAQGSSRIVGGVEADRGEFPFIISLQKNGRHICGGSLIAKKFVLTAAHCVKGASASSFAVKLGLHKQSDSQGVEKFSVKKITIHPDYDSWKSSHDWAVLELSGQSRMTPVMLNAETIDIAAEESDAPIATTAGWGTTSQGGSVSPVLRKVDVPLVNAERCGEAYPDSIDDTMICAGFEEGGKDSCQGDSGGPLVVKAGSRNPVLIGVVSWGEGCARPKKYGVYSKVSAAVEWIHEQVSRN